jgi:hypothetical protein
MADLTDAEKVRIRRHLGFESLEPFSDYVLLYVNPALLKCNSDAAILAEVRTLLTSLDTIWTKYQNSLTKLELESAGDIKFHKSGEQRLLRVHRTTAVRLARVLGLRTNFKSRSGGILYR